MNILLVDDFPAIVESLKNGIDWRRSGVENVYTACSAREAKLVLVNFEVGVLICDIEMPEENGLELVTWAKKRFPDLECIFLTAHAEFDYVKQALQIGSFDYILQPVKYTDVEKAIEKVAERIAKKDRQKKLAAITEKAMDRGSETLEIMTLKLSQGKEEEANRVCEEYRYMCGYYFEKCITYPLVVNIVKWNRISRMLKPENVRQALGKVFMALFDEGVVKIAGAHVKENEYWFLIFADETRVKPEIWREKVEDFYQLAEKNMECEISVYPCYEEVSDYVAAFRSLEERMMTNVTNRHGVIVAPTDGKEGKVRNPAIEEALKFVRKNLNKNVSRSEVAGEVHLSEEYFSRLFRQETGDTFKNYVSIMKMEAAKDFLAKTQLSVSIIASKVGYSNFSHFSQVFKGYTGVSPQEYRKNPSDKEK